MFPREPVDDEPGHGGDHDALLRCRKGAPRGEIELGEEEFWQDGARHGFDLRSGDGGEGDEDHEAEGEVAVAGGAEEEEDGPEKEEESEADQARSLEGDEHEVREGIVVLEEISF